MFVSHRGLLPIVYGRHPTPHIWLCSGLHGDLLCGWHKTFMDLSMSLLGPSRELSASQSRLPCWRKASLGLALDTTPVASGDSYVLAPPAAGSPLACALCRVTLSMGPSRASVPFQGPESLAPAAIL